MTVVDGAPEDQRSSDAGGPSTSDACSALSPADGTCTLTGDGGCASCDPLSSICVDGSCRALAWSSPQSPTVEPQPALNDDRLYASVPQDTLYAQHIRIAYPGLLVRLGMLASTGQSPEMVGLALYDDDSGYPSHALATPAMQVSTTNASGGGRQELSVTPPLHIEPGAYWIAFVSEAAAFALQSPGGDIATAEAQTSCDGNPWLDPFPATTDPANPIQGHAIIIYATVALDPM